MAAQTMSLETILLMKKWKDSKSNFIPVKPLKSCLSRLYINKALIRFLDEFTNQFVFAQLNKRVKILLLCRKLLIQYPPKIDKDHYRAFQEEYDFDIANDTGIDPVKWIDEELSYIREVREVDEKFGASELGLKHLQTSAPTTEVARDASREIMTKEEILNFFKWSESSLYRMKKRGFPAYKMGGKTVVIKAEALAWRDPKEARKVEISLANNKQNKRDNHGR